MLETRSESFLVTATVRPVRLTTHAQVRQQQRGIRHEVLDCLLAFGRREHDHQRCEIVYFDDRALEAVQKDAGPQFGQLASDHRGVYAVIDSDGCVVTTVTGSSASCATGANRTCAPEAAASVARARCRSVPRVWGQTPNKVQ